jgi:hypothetical protein
LYSEIYSKGFKKTVAPAAVDEFPSIYLADLAEVLQDMPKVYGCHVRNFLFSSHLWPSPARSYFSKNESEQRGFPVCLRFGDV